MANVNFCSTALTDYAPEKLLSSAVHELIHCLGFTDLMFGLYVGSDGGTLGISSVVKKIEAAAVSPNLDGPSDRSNYRSGFNMLVTPNVMAQARHNLSGASFRDHPATSWVTRRGIHFATMSPLQARDQFNCQNLMGAPLEDQGGSGSQGSHWEFELFQV